MIAFGRFVEGFRLLVLAAAACLVGFGVALLRDAPVDALPEFTPPYAEVQTEALGLSAEEVEELITVPLEANMLNGVQGIETIRSESVPGMSSIVMLFEPGTDIYRARQLVEERLNQAYALPNVSKPPTLLQPLSTSNRVLVIGMSSDTVSPIEQSVLARWTVRPRLLGVPGVANVSVWGMRDLQLQVQVDPALLRDSDVTLSQVVSSAGNAQVVSPLTFLEASTPGTGGYVETPQQRLQVRHLLEKLADPAELGKVPVEGTDGALRLSDVATIVVDHQPLIGDAVVSGGQGLVLVVEKFPGADTVAVTEGVEAALEALRPGLGGITTDVDVFRPARYIEDSLDNLALALGLGAALLLLVLVALRRSWLSVVVSTVSIAVSWTTALVVLRLLDEGLNTLVLLGLAGALAVIVDEAVGSSDRLAAPGAGDGSAALGATATAWTRARTPVAFATVIALLAIAPVAVVGGRPGDFLAPLVIAYACAVVAALVVGWTVAPALASLARGRRAALGAASPLRRRVDRASASMVRRARGGVRPAVATGAVLAVLGLASLPFVSVALLPELQDRDILVRLEGEPGTSAPAMTRLTSQLATRLEGLPGVDRSVAHVGRAVTGDRVTTVSSSDIWLSLEGDAPRDETLDAITAVAANVEGAVAEVATYSERKLRDVGAIATGENRAQGLGFDVLTGAHAPLTVRVYGEDLDILSVQAERVRRALAAIPGVLDPLVAAPVMQSTLEIEVDLDRAREAEITPGDVRRAEATLLQGIHVGSVFQDQKVFDVIVQGEPSTRASIANVSELLIDTPTGAQVRLGDVADVRVVKRPSAIERDAVSRRLDVVAQVSGRRPADIIADTRAMLLTLDLPLAYHAAVVGRSTAEEVGLGRVVGFAVGTLVAVFLVLQAAFSSWRLAGLVSGLLLVSLSGGLVAAALAGGVLTLGSFVGLLAVLGLATRHALVLGRQAFQQEAGEDRAEPPLREAGESVGTALVVNLAIAALVLPVAVLGVRPGLELLQPLAVVVLGGLVTTSLAPPLLLAAIPLARPAGGLDERPSALPGQPDVIDLRALPLQVPVGSDGSRHLLNALPDGALPGGPLPEGTGS